MNKEIKFLNQRIQIFKSILLTEYVQFFMEPNAKFSSIFDKHKKSSASIKVFESQASRYLETLKSLQKIQLELNQKYEDMHAPTFFRI